MPNNVPVGTAYSDPDLTQLFIDGVEVTATAAEINAGSPAGVTAGVVTASKGVVVDANKRAATFGALTFGEPNAYFAVTTISAGATQTQAGATALTGEFNNVTTVDAAGDGVKLPAAAAGNVIAVKNSGANILAVYPATSDSIDALAVNLPVRVAVGSTVVFRAISAVVWESSTDETLTINAPTTASGQLVIKAANSVGNTQTTIVNASQAAARTYTIPDGGANASFLMTEGAQTINGVQTTTLPRVLDSNTTITAFAGGGQGSATALTGEYNTVTVCDTAADSVKLPAAVAGQIITVRNIGAASCAVFPATGDAINALAVNLSIDVPVLGEVTFQAVDATTWYTNRALSLPAPSTQKGSLIVKAADSAGNTETVITNASQAAARTYTIPDGGANANFVMTTGTATATSATTTELSNLAGVAAGTVTASKAVVVGANKNLDTLVIADSGLKLGSGAGTAVTATAAELNKMDGIPASVTVVVTTPGASGTCDAAFTFLDAAGATCAFATAMDFYLSGVDGLTITAAITSILAADTPVGAVGVVTTGQQGKLVTTAGGLGSVKLTGAAATTYYLTFLGPGGRLIISPALLTKA